MISTAIQSFVITEYPEPRRSSGSAFGLSTCSTNHSIARRLLPTDPIQVLECLEEAQTIVDERDHAFYVLASSMDACPMIPWW